MYTSTQKALIKKFLANIDAICTVSVCRITDTDLDSFFRQRIKETLCTKNDSAELNPKL